MLFSIINEKEYQVKIFKINPDEIDIYDNNKIEKLLKIILAKLITKKKVKGLLILNIYLDNNYGIIVNIKNEPKNFNDKEVELKIVFNVDSIFLYKIESIEFIKKINIKSKNIYYYKDNFYLEILDRIEIDDYLRLLEYSNDIIYRENLILKYGIKIN